MFDFLNFFTFSDLLRNCMKRYVHKCVGFQINILYLMEEVLRGGGGVGGSRFAGWPAQYSTVSKYNNSGSIRVQLNPVDDGQISNLS